MQKALSHGEKEGKLPLANIFLWLDEEFLVLMSEAMRVPVEELKRYPKDNWKNGRGDQDFIKARFNCAARHLAEAVKNPLSVDSETQLPHLIHLAVNAMMLWRCSEVKDIVAKPLTQSPW